jgi:futalosine hydrolase
MPMRLLVVTAVAAEQDAVAAGLGAASGATDPGGPGTAELVPGGTLRRLPSGDVLAAGVGPAAAAVGASAALALARATVPYSPYDVVISAGIGGGFQPVAPVGSVVVADMIVAADLGAETPGGFVSVTGLGFGRVEHPTHRKLSLAATRALDAVHAPVLTVSTVTGSAERAAALAARHPGAAAEAMEGFGVAEAAAAHGVPVLEIRTISNPVGPRDRAGWQIGRALAALTGAFWKLTPLLDEEGPC